MRGSSNNARFPLPDLMLRHGIDMGSRRRGSTRRPDLPRWRRSRLLVTSATSPGVHDRATLGVQRLSSCDRLDKCHPSCRLHDGQWAVCAPCGPVGPSGAIKPAHLRTRGLSHSEHQALVDALAPPAARDVGLAARRRWLERNLPGRRPIGGEVIAHAVIADSSRHVSAA